jgi:NAD+ diphosphatase
MHRATTPARAVFPGCQDGRVSVPTLESEIAEANWVTVPSWAGLSAPATGPDGDPSLLLPGKVSVARSMLESWAAL